MIARAATLEERNALAQRLGTRISEDARGIVAVDGTGAVRGGVLYDMWTENMVQCHMATDTPMAWRALLPAAFVYPFEHAGRNVLLGVIRASNEASLKMAAALGFTEGYRVKDGYEAGVDLVFVEMRRSECRYLKEVQ